MSDEKRIKRLTDLARKAWPGVELVVASTGKAAGVHESGGGERLLAMVLASPRALDALESALHVLAGDAWTIEACYRQVEAAHGHLPMWVEQLATSWEDAARDYIAQAQQHPHHSALEVACATLLRECATMLRERAKEER